MYGTFNLEVYENKFNDSTFLSLFIYWLHLGALVYTYRGQMIYKQSPEFNTYIHVFSLIIFYITEMYFLRNDAFIYFFTKTLLQVTK